MLYAYKNGQQDTTATRRFKPEDTPIALSRPQLDYSKRSVKFCRQVRVRNILHLNNFTDDEIESCWYSKSEYAQMQRDITFAANLLERKENRLDCNSDDGAVCTRGVESRTSRGAKRKVGRRLKVLSFVLDEQMDQANRGKKDEDMLARLSQACSHKSVLEAAMQGRLDGEDSYIKGNSDKSKETRREVLYTTNKNEGNTRRWSGSELYPQKDEKLSPPNNFAPLSVGRQNKNTLLLIL